MRKRVFCTGWLVLGLLAASAAANAQWTWTPQTGRWINVKHLPRETAELQLEHARALMLKRDYKPALRETRKFTTFYGDEDLADENQYLRGEIFLAQRDLKRAAKEFQLVVTNYPESDLYDKVIAKQYEIGDGLYDKGEANHKKWWRLFRNRPFKKAIEVYTMVIDNQPFTNTAAEAQYKLGLCQFTREDYLAAAYDYRRVVEDYAASDWVDDASYGLAECYYRASLPAAYDQSPSELTIRAVDNFVERFPDDPRAKELQGKRSEMRETIARQRLRTAQFYEKRREFDAARISFSIVVKEYGETAAAAVAGRWLTKNPASETPEPTNAQGTP